MKKKIILMVSIFIIGLIVGSIGAVIYFGNTINKTDNISSMIYIADLKGRAFQAYKNEKPEVGIWALKNLAQVLEKRLEIEDETKATQFDLALTYGRLAIKLKSIGDISGYEENLNKALSFIQQASPEEDHTEQKIIDFVNKSDEVKNKNT
jgi:hypothetical protein